MTCNNRYASDVTIMADENVENINIKYEQMLAEHQILRTRYEMLLRTQITGMDDSSGIGDMLRRTEALEMQIKKMQEQNHTLEITLDAKEAYISHITQIIRERSCSPRGIPNKRKSTGYVVTALVQQTERTGGDYSQECVCWKLTLQTYYDKRYSFSAIEEELISDIRATLFPLLYTQEVMDYRASSTEQIIAFALGGSPYVALYRVKAKLDLRQDGYWQVELYLTEEPAIPEELLPQQQKQKKEQGNAQQSEKNNVTDGCIE